MKAVAFCGSPHEKGNTALALQTALDVIASEGIETELIQVGGRKITGCVGCGSCFKSGRCFQNDEEFDSWFKSAHEADAIILGSPVYYAGINGTMKSFLDRLFYQSAGRFANKIGAGIAICRRSGGMTTFEQLNAYFLISNMFIAPSSYWSVGHGAAAGEVLQDLEAISTFEQVGHNIVWLLKAKEQFGCEPKKSEKVRFNFIR